MDWVVWDVSALFVNVILLEDQFFSEDNGCCSGLGLNGLGDWVCFDGVGSLRVLICA